MSRARVAGGRQHGGHLNAMAAMDGVAKGQWLQACLELNEPGHEGGAMGMLEEAARMGSVQAMNDLTFICFPLRAGMWRAASSPPSGITSWR